MALIESMAKQYFKDIDSGRKDFLPLNPQAYKKSDKSEEVPRYQAIVIGLLFIARITRPEISIHVNLLGQQTQSHSLKTYQTALPMLRYLYQTRFEGLCLKKPNTNSLEVTIYANPNPFYAREQARSQTEVLITLEGQLAGQYSRRQEVVSLSITEVEYIANCEGAKDIAWIAQFLQELKVVRKPVLYTNSEGVYNLSRASKFARRSRHIKHRFYYLYQQVQGKKLEVKTITSKNNPADPLPKLLPMMCVNKQKDRWMCMPGTEAEWLPETETELAQIKTLE